MAEGAEKQDDHGDDDAQHQRFGHAQQGFLDGFARVVKDFDLHIRVLGVELVDHFADSV